MRVIAVAAVATSLLAAPRLARADDPPPGTLRAMEFSPYEKGAIDDALAKLHETVDPDPEGKIVEGIDIVTLDVIDDRDPVPKLINVLHVTTRRYVVDREILLRPGEPYRTVTVEESVRNLRSLPQLSLVVALPVRGSGSDRVRILVVTKDVWSLRLNWDVQASSGGLEDFVMQPSETNFLGTHQVASLYFEYDPATLTFGAGYHVPRVAGTRNVIDASADVVINQATGAPEGSYGALLATQPLYSARTPWAWDSFVDWDTQISRRFVNARESGYSATVGTASVVVPWEYKTRTYLAQEALTRSFGWDVKHDVSLGAFSDLRSYAPTQRLAAYNHTAVSEFVTANVPRSDNRNGAFLQYHSYRTRFIRVLDFQTLGLQEDYRLGHEVYVRVYPTPKAFGSSRDVLGVYASAGYTFALGDGLMRAIVESSTEADTTQLSDASILLQGQIVTPRFGFGRLVYDAQFLSRYRNYLNHEEFLGGGSRLRGYPSNFFVGKDLLVSNLEFRSRPVEILHAMELGGALFYDVGDAANGVNNLIMKQSVGFGARALFPQLDRLVFRVDVGFPVAQGATIPGVQPWSFFVAFEQAFGFPSQANEALPSGPQ